MKSLSLLLAGLVLSTISKLIAASTLAVVRMLVAVPCLLAVVVFTVREAARHLARAAAAGQDL